MKNQPTLFKTCNLYSRHRKVSIPASLVSNNIKPGFHVVVPQLQHPNSHVPGNVPPGFYTQVVGPGSGGGLGSVPVLPGDATRVRVPSSPGESSSNSGPLLRLEVLIR